ncbi:MAG: flagellar biosynthesis protein FlhB [Phycisphaerales bacterium]|nr:flagellar biosynthesis protein FlhB [Phycisphaerales bacterium]
MAEDLGEKTEQPTQHRLLDARRRGRVAKSADLSAAVDLLGAVIVLVAVGGLLIRGMSTLIRRLLEGETLGDALTVESMTDGAKWAAWQGVMVVIPVLLLMFVVAAVGQVMQVGLLFSPEPLRPKLERLNPIAGVKRMFSKRNLVKSVVNTGKLVLVVAISWLVIGRWMPRLIGLAALDPVPGMLLLARAAAELALWLVFLLLVLGVIDFMYQKWQHSQDLRMTKQEVKDERRSMEGDPQMKGRRMRLMRQIAMQRIQAAVPDADVVVTNPTHFAVALRYESESMGAPRLIAKGADYMAVRIRHVAVAHGVPIVERPPLARAVYYGVEVGREIPPHLYEAVAEILAYVYRLEGRASHSAAKRGGARGRRRAARAQR